jgi:CRP-like cAMP-binding protein
MSQLVKDLDVVHATCDVHSTKPKELTARDGDSFFVLRVSNSSQTVWCVSTRGAIGVLPLSSVSVDDVSSLAADALPTASQPLRLSVHTFVDSAWKELLMVDDVTCASLVRDVLARVSSTAAGAAVLYAPHSNRFLPLDAALGSCAFAPRDEPYRLKFFVFDVSKLHSKPSRRLSDNAPRPLAASAAPVLAAASPSDSSATPQRNNAALSASAAPTLTSAPTRPAPKLNRPAPEVPLLRSSAPPSVDVNPLSDSTSPVVPPPFLSPRSAHDFHFQIPTTSSASADGKSFTTYTIEFLSERNKQRTITKRYSEFVSLHAELVALFPSADVPPLPKKKLLNNLDTDFVERRRVKLLKWLTAVSQQPVLSKSSLFLAFLHECDGMNSDDFAELFDGTIPVPFEAFTIIVQESEPNDTLFLISEGICSVEIASLQVAFLGVGDFFGEHTAVLGARRATATIVAQRAVTVRMLRRGELMARMRANAALGARLLRTLALRLSMRFLQLPLEVAARPQLAERGSALGESTEDRTVMARADFQRRFHLAPHDTVLTRFECEHARARGTLFVSQRACCFWAKSFGVEVAYKVMWSKVEEETADGVEVAFVDAAASERKRFRLPSVEQAQALLRAIETRVAVAAEQTLPERLGRSCTAAVASAASGGADEFRWLAMNDTEWQTLGRTRSLKSGAVLYRQNMGVRSLFQVVHGTLRVQREASANAPAQVLGFVELGGFANEHSFLAGGALDTCVAETDCRVCEIEFDSAAHFFSIDRALEAKFLFAIGSALARRLERREAEILSAAQLAPMTPRFYAVRFHRKRRGVAAHSAAESRTLSERKDDAPPPPPTPPPSDEKVVIIDAESFVYKVLPALTLGKFQSKLRDDLMLPSSPFGPLADDQIVFVNDNDDLDLSMLASKKLYLQIAAVLPKGGSVFARDSGMARDTDPLHKQQKRRVCYVVADANFAHRSPVARTFETVLSPIQNAIEMLCNRVQLLADELAFDPLRTHSLQQLLQGSVAPMVNAGPLAIARAFLGADRQPDAVTGASDALRARLREVLCQFLEWCEDGITENGRICRTAPARAFQNMIETFFAQLQSELKPLIE